MSSNAFRELILPAIKQAAIALGASSFELEDGEHVLMVRGTEGFLVYLDPYGRVLMPYCCVMDSIGLTSETAGDLHHHQHGELLTRDSWVWLPRIGEGAPTSYHVKKQGPDQSFEWFVQRIRPLEDVSLRAMNGDELIADLADRIASDFNEQIASLKERAPRLQPS